MCRRSSGRTCSRSGCCCDLSARGRLSPAKPHNEPNPAHSDILESIDLVRGSCICSRPDRRLPAGSDGNPHTRTAPEHPDRKTRQLRLAELGLRFRWLYFYFEDLSWSKHV